MILICGRYEGVDERVVEHLITDEVSIGDYVLSGGEIPAMVVVDAVTRLIPGALGCEQSARTRIIRRRVAGLSALHAAGRVPRDESARRASERQPRRD